MNETIASILGRRSVRSYTNQPVERGKLDLILECGRYAPSGMNTQPWHFTVVTNRSLLSRISDASRDYMLKSPSEQTRKYASAPDFDCFRGAPVAIIVSGRGENSLPNCANAMENMAVAAFSLGLGSCYIGSFKAVLAVAEGQWILDELKIPSGYQPHFALSLGYGNENPGPRAPRAENTVTYL